MKKGFNAVKELAIRARQKALIGGVAAALGTVATGAHAAGDLDVSAVVTVIASGAAAIASIGVAVLSIYGTIAIYQWVKRPIK